LKYASKSSRTSGDAHIDLVAAERDALGLEQLALLGALGQRAVGANDSMPGHGRVVALRQHRAGLPRRAGRDVAVGAHEAGRDGADALQDAFGGGQMLIGGRQGA
jgi:hypothetical protein